MGDWKSNIKEPAGLVSSEDSLFVFQMVSFCWLFTRSSYCACGPLRSLSVSKSPPLIRNQSHWIRAYSNGLIFNVIASLKSVFKGFQFKVSKALGLGLQHKSFERTHFSLLWSPKRGKLPRGRNTDLIPSAWPRNVPELDSMVRKKWSWKSTYLSLGARFSQPFLSFVNPKDTET